MICLSAVIMHGYEISMIWAMGISWLKKSNYMEFHAVIVFL